jgi:hypothetical protein
MCGRLKDIGSVQTAQEEISDKTIIQAGKMRAHGGRRGGSIGEEHESSKLSSPC